jgi:hypothetical protein
MESAREILTVTAALREALPNEVDEIERAYMARQLVQCTLPHSDPGNIPVWKRQNGHFVLSILPARDTETGRTIGYPYGSLPRLLLFWIVSEAVRTQSRRLELGDNLADFMRQLGLHPKGRGKRSDAKRLAQQGERLFRCLISFTATIPGAKRWKDMQIAPEGELWWDTKLPAHSSFWNSWIELGEKFYNAITAAPVPLDMQALRKLKQSPLALDLYALSAFKAYHANRLQRVQVIPWSGLLAQLGANYRPERLDNFQARIKSTMRKVAAVFPAGQLQIEYQPARRQRGRNVEGGIHFLPGSVLPILPGAKNPQAQ